MLSLTIKEGEKIWIGDNIQVGVYDAKAGRIVLWIEAPKDIKILRDKLYQRAKHASKPQEDRTNHDKTHDNWGGSD